MRAAARSRQARSAAWYRRPPSVDVNIVVQGVVDCAVQREVNYAVIVRPERPGRVLRPEDRAQGVDRWFPQGRPVAPGRHAKPDAKSHRAWRQRRVGNAAAGIMNLLFPGGGRAGPGDLDRQMRLARRARDVGGDGKCDGRGSCVHLAAEYRVETLRAARRGGR